ncbi:hypothetical protein I4641_12560 [Waterburya agarophytonicola K14]|uniref:Uncharacterized protein n=1 Tax=Waterburya agarophytonicola KI4 TaxID=2874699 RepID=A0A964BQW0_9CYAN|nr:hypothetical protein [Waterburya agarophytonicola]MCC0177810.1 hypothetical protein [Waterburya agarophytonicola KI4]
MPNPNNPNKSNSNVNSHGKPRINLDERIAKKQSRVSNANDKFRNSFRASNKQIAVSSGEAIEDRLLYEASKDLEEQLLDEQYDAVVRANNRYAAMVNNAVAQLEAEEDENVRLLTEVEDDVIDADFEEIKVEFQRTSRFTSSKFLNSSNEDLRSLPSSSHHQESQKPNKYQVELPE